MTNAFQYDPGYPRSFFMLYPGGQIGPVETSQADPFGSFIAGATLGAILFLAGRVVRAAWKLTKENRNI